MKQSKKRVGGEMWVPYRDWWGVVVAIVKEAFQLVYGPELDPVLQGEGQAAGCDCPGQLVAQQGKHARAVLPGIEAPG